ncbi:MAG: trimethylamine methyltransferase family protein [Desulfobacterales bacterium]|nr:trimethylamine methyltransferase family protein [Desulfobacterales bacterium]
MSEDIISNARIAPISLKPDMRVRFFSDNELEQIHQATLTVLQKAGVRFPSKKALETFAKAGANVDFKKQIVKIPPDLLMKTLAKAPKEYVMGSRGSKGLDVILDGKTSYLGTDGTGMATIDFETDIRRDSTKVDVGNMALISDYLQSIGFYWPMVGATDVAPPLISLHELDASFNNTEKHVHIVTCTEKAQAKYCVEMACAVADSQENIKKRPPLSLLVCPISPLSQDVASLETALVFAEAGLPVGFATMSTLGSTAPASIPGLFVMGNAELLSSLCYVQLECPGAPVYYAFYSMMMNPYTGGSLTHPALQPVMNNAVVEIGKYYNIPVMAGFGCGNSRDLWSWDQGMGSSVDSLLMYQCGADLMPTVGLMEECTLLHYEGLVLDDKIFNYVKGIADGLTINEETLAVDEIISVGPGGHFLDKPLTFKNLRGLWEQGVDTTWDPQKGDFKDTKAAAREKTQWILDNHKPVPLEDNVKKEFQKILKAAETELVK